MDVAVREQRRRRGQPRGGAAGRAVPDAERRRDVAGGELARARLQRCRPGVAAGVGPPGARPDEPAPRVAPPAAAVARPAPTSTVTFEALPRVFLRLER